MLKKGDAEEKLGDILEMLLLYGGPLLIGKTTPDREPVSFRMLAARLLR